MPTTFAFRGLRRAIESSDADNAITAISAHHRQIASPTRKAATMAFDWQDLLIKSCSIDSRTQAGAPGTTQVAQIYGKVLESLGFTLIWHDTLPEEGPRGKHLQAVRNNGADKGLLLVGHTDTVLGPEHVPVRVDKEKGLLLGAGSCDMKGGDVMMLDALHHALANSKAVQEARIDVILNCTEEIPGNSFPKVARAAAESSKVCLSFEPARYSLAGDLEFVTSRKGRLRFQLHSKGRAAHSGNNHAFGVNAIREIARKVEIIEQLTDVSKDLTLNVGIIRGGSASNQVPEAAWIEFDVRAYEPELLEETRKKIVELCMQPTVASVRDGAVGELELKQFPAYPCWPDQERDKPLADLYKQIAARHGLTLQGASSGGGADCSEVSHLIPTIDGLGILGGDLHQTSEWADLKSFPLRSKITAELFHECCSRSFK